MKYSGNHRNNQAQASFVLYRYSNNDVNNMSPMEVDHLQADEQCGS